MEPITTIAPIAFWKTPSFWAGIVPTALTTLDLAFQALAGENGAPVAGAVASIAALVGLDWTAEQIAGFMQTLYPLYLLVFAQQRGTFSGAIPRPYTADASKEQIVVRAIENGKTAFEAGKAIGKAIKR